MSDDIDGSLDAQTVSFGLEGVTYEIDLSDKNRSRLDKALAPFIDHSRRVGRTRRRSSPHQSTARSNGDNVAIRAWAREQGLKVSERGRISAEVLRLYEEAQ